MPTFLLEPSYAQSKYNDLCIWNPNEGFNILVFLKQLPCTVEQMQNNITALQLKGLG